MHCLREPGTALMSLLSVALSSVSGKHIHVNKFGVWTHPLKFKIVLDKGYTLADKRRIARCVKSADRCCSDICSSAFLIITADAASGIACKKQAEEVKYVHI